MNGIFSKFSAKYLQLSYYDLNNSTIKHRNFQIDKQNIMWEISDLFYTGFLYFQYNQDCTDKPADDFCQDGVGVPNNHQFCVPTCFVFKCNSRPIDERFTLKRENSSTNHIS